MGTSVRTGAGAGGALDKGGGQRAGGGWEGPGWVATGQPVPLGGSRCGEPSCGGLLARTRWVLRTVQDDIRAGRGGARL